MIVDIQKGGFAKGLIEYHEKKIAEGNAVLLYNNTLADRTKDKVATYVETAELNKRIRTNKFLHISVSFNKKDPGVEPEKMTTIGLHYLKEMGIEDTPVLIYQHGDKSHQHFHIVTTTMNYSGEKIPDAHDHYRSMALTRKMELELGLEITKYSNKRELKLQEINATKYKIYNSLNSIKMSAGALAEIQQILPEDYTNEIKANKLSDYDIQQGILKRGLPNESIGLIWRTLNKHDLITKTHKETLMTRLAQIKQLSSNRDEFLMKVEQAGLYVRKIASRQGSSKLVFGLSDQNFYVNEKEIPVAFRYDYLFTGKKIDQAFDKEAQRKYLRRLINKSLMNAASIPAFEKELDQNNIKYEYAQNNGGVYGISFQSRNIINPILFKGSEIDKSLSWNGITKKLLSKDMVAPQIVKKQSGANPLQPLSMLNRLMVDEQDEDTKRKRRSDQDQSLNRS